MLLDITDTLKLADFTRSLINSSDASMNYEIRSRLPGVTRRIKKSDIFALGSAIFELATSHPPYPAQSYKAMQNQYRNGKFKKVNNLPELGHIITKC